MNTTSNKLSEIDTALEEIIHINDLKKELNTAAENWEKITTLKFKATRKIHSLIINGWEVKFERLHSYSNYDQK